jgi:uroporphyrinogen-III synthase
MAKSAGMMSIGVFEGRMGAELCSLVVRHGGVPRLAPAVREVRLDAGGEVEALLRALRAGEVAVVVYLTGAGASALFAEADRTGVREELVTRLRRVMNVCRGRKPWQPLRANGVPVTATAAEPFTSAEVLCSLECLVEPGAGVALLHYGERSDELAAELRARRFGVLELSLYEWRLPVDTGPLERMVDDVLAGEVDAVAFTSQVQVRHLFEIADRLGRGRELVAALAERVPVAAVGPSCAGALRAHGVEPRVVPDNPKMGPMVKALAEYLRERCPVEPGIPAPPSRTPRRNPSTRRTA